MVSEIARLWHEWKKVEANLEFISDMRTSADDGERNLWRQTKAKCQQAQTAYRSAYWKLSTPQKAIEHERRKEEKRSMKELKRAYGS